MANNRLIPPSHFTPDSLESSPTNFHGNLINTPKLKTPNDFVISNLPQEYAESASSLACHHYDDKSSARKGEFSLRNDSGIELVGNFPHSGNTLTRQREDHGMMDLIKELKEENNNLKSVVKLRELQPTEPQVPPSVGIISHQVKFIERLQSDISSLNLKLKNKDGEVIDREREIQRLNLLLKEKEEIATSCGIHVSTLESQRETNLRKVLKLEQNVQTLVEEKQAIMIRADKEKVKQIEEHDANIKMMEQKWLETQRNVERNFEIEKQHLEEKHAVAISEYKEKCNKMALEHEERTDQLNQELHRINSVQVQLDSNHTIQLNECEQKKLELNETIRSLESHIQDLKTKCYAQDNLVEELKTKVGKEKDLNLKMKKYMKDVQAEDVERLKWKEEKGKLENKIEMAEQEVQDLLKSLEVLNVRFESVSTILEMQENAVKAHCSAIQDEHSQNRAAVVTSQWRQKVFELMVRGRTLEIVNREESAKHKIILKALNGKLQDQIHESGILSNKVKDIEARMELTNYSNNQLTKSNEKLKFDIETHLAQIKEKDKTLRKLMEIFTSFREKYMNGCENNSSKHTEMILRLEQRLLFANNRIKTIRDLLARRETKWRLLFQKVKENSPNNNTESEHPDLVAEVALLTEERNTLSRQLADDAATFEHRTSDFNEREILFRRKVKDAEKLIENLRKEAQNLKSQISSLESKVEKSEDDKHAAISCLKVAKNEKEKGLESLKEEMQFEFEAKSKENELRLNQVGRELTKTVVTLRQLERSSAREKSRFAEQLELERGSWKAEEEKLRNEMKQLEKYNNVIVTTLRQEGLMDIVRSLRNRPITLQEPKKVKFSATNTDENDAQITPRDLPLNEPLIIPQNTPQINRDNMDQMLQDLTNLSEKVLADTDSD